MHNDKDLSTWQTFRRLWPTIAPFKAGLIVAGVALILNAASDTFMLSLLKPLLDDGFGKKISLRAGVDAAGGDRADDFTWYHQLCLQLLYLLGIRKGGNDHASPPVWSHDGNASFIL